MRTLIENRLLALCEKYSELLIPDNAWRVDTLLSIVWKYPSNHEGWLACENLGSDIKVLEVEQLIEELKTVYAKLAELGVSKEKARQILWEKEQISRIIVRRDGRIVLPDYGVELTFSPLQLAVYVLFVRHAEGISYKNLPDYRDELMEILLSIYSVSNRMVNEARLSRMINRLTDPIEGTIKEVVSKIRHAFIKAIGSVDSARHYYIYGSRGMAKRICIDRDFVFLE